MFYIQVGSLLNGRWFRARYNSAYATREEAETRLNYLRNLAGGRLHFRIANARGKAV